MNLLKGSGNVIYGFTTLSAFLCGFLVSLTLLVGFGYAGLAGDAPGDAGFMRYSVVAMLGIFGTVVLFIGLLGVLSVRRTFPSFTAVGAIALLIPLGFYAVAGLRGRPLVWTLSVILIEIAALILASVELKQLRTNLR